MTCHNCRIESSRLENRRAGTTPPSRLMGAKGSEYGELRRFLAEDLHLMPHAIEDALDEMKRSGAGSIHPVAISPRQLKKLGLS